LYAAVAWALTEVLGFLIEAFPFLPDWTNTVVALLFVLGFPVSMFLAWMFDLGSDGKIRATPGSVRGGFAIAVSALMLFLGTAGLFALIYPEGPPATAVAEIEPRMFAGNSIAVLPFQVSGSHEISQYLVDGLADELITLLTQIQGLHVAARNSTFQFRGRNSAIDEIRQQLRVLTLVDGSIQKVGDSFRLTAQLIDTDTGYQIWAATFDRNEDDLYSLPAGIARAVVERLGLSRSAIVPAGDVNPEAHRLYLKGDYLLREGQEEADLREALRLFEAALTIEPGYTPALVGSAQTWITLSDQAIHPVDDGYGRARVIAERAVSIDSNMAQAHWVLGWIALYHDWDWPKAERYLRDALLLQPGDTKIIGANAALEQVQGRLERAIDLARQVTLRDPLRASASGNLAYFAWVAGAMDIARAAALRTLELDPQYPGAHLMLAQFSLEQGDHITAREEIDREAHPLLKKFGEALLAHEQEDDAAELAAIAQLEKSFSQAGAYQIAELYAHRDDADSAFEWLDRAYSVRDPGLVQLKVDPLMENIRSDSRYSTMLKRLNMASP